MQAGMFVLILTTTAYAPLALLSGWLHTVAKYNPVTQIVEAARQGFVGGVTWGDTWPGLLALAGLLAVLTAFALRGHAPHRRVNDGPRSREPASRASRRSSRPGARAASWAEGERDGVPYAYTRPSPARYPWQWYWDSCFAAIVWRRFDPERSRAELETLLARLPTGRVRRPRHLLGPPGLAAPPLSTTTSPRGGADDRDDPAAAARLGVADRRRRPGRRAAHRPPPRVAARRTATSRATACCGWSSPTSRASTPRRSSTRSGAGGRTRGSGFPLLVARNRRLGWDARRVRDAGGPGPLRGRRPTCSGGSRAWRWASPRSPRRWSIGSGTSGGGCSSTRRSRAALRPAVETWAALAPLALPDLPEAIGRRLVEEHLLDPRRFWLPVPPPSVSAAEPSFEPGRGRGLEAPLLARPDLGQRRLDAVARPGPPRLPRRSRARWRADWARRCSREGLREYYHPRTGEGLGATDFAWTA